VYLLRGETGSAREKSLQGPSYRHSRTVCRFSPFQGFSADCSGAVVCWLFNTGTTNATISRREIWNSIKVPASVALTGDSCNTVLMPGKSCQFFAGTGAGTYTCRANTNGIDNHISGTMQLYNSADALLVTIPMAK
jgi:hypothetical protein